MDLLRHNLKKRVLNENKTDVQEEVQEEEVVEVEQEQVNNKQINDYFKTELEKLKLNFDQQLNYIKKELLELKNFRIKENKVEDKIEDIVEDKVEAKLNEELDIFTSVPIVEKELKPKSKAKKTINKKEAAVKK